MDEVKAREILGDMIQGDPDHKDALGKGLEGHGGDIPMALWEPVRWETTWDEATLEGDFSADTLEAIAWWMRNKKPKKKIAITLPEPDPGMPGIRVDRMPACNDEPGVTIIHSELEVVIIPGEPMSKGPQIGRRGER